jgi:hypothetical protein
MNTVLILPKLVEKRYKKMGMNILTENDFHPCYPFFKNSKYKPESIKKIIVKGVLETTPYLREILKKIDYLLQNNGELDIHYFLTSRIDSYEGDIRALNRIMNEVSLCYNHRYKLNEHNTKQNYGIMKFKKIKKVLNEQDSIEKWSFGIVSDGRKNEKIGKIIQRIKTMNIPEYEILVCGPSSALMFKDTVRIIDDADLYRDIRIPISAKKNRIIDNATYENLVLIHDRIQFPHDWYKRMKEYGNYFDFLCTKVLDEDTESKRILDWLEFRGALSDNDVCGKQLTYTEWTPYIYIDGGYIIGKKSKFEKTSLNKYLNWGEAEDLIFSKNILNAGNMINFYSDCYVTSATNRHQGVSLTAKAFHRINSSVRIKLSALFGKQYLKRKQMMKLYCQYLEEDVLR